MHFRKAGKRRESHQAQLDLPQALQTFVELVSVALPDAEVSIDPPEDAKGVFWIDIRLDQFQTTLSWKLDFGFGIFTNEAIFGERPDEVYRPPELAAQRIRLLCEQWVAFRMVSPLWLGEVRKLTGAVQAEVASALHCNQPAISKLETREDVKLSSLASYLEAMGGRLEIRVHFKDWDATIALPESLASR